MKRCWMGAGVALVGLMAAPVGAQGAGEVGSFSSSVELRLARLELAQAAQPEMVRLAALKETTASGQLGPVGAASSLVLRSINLRLGAQISPRGKFIAGIDYTLPVGLGNLQARLDAEAIFSANFGGVRTIFPVTINAVYAKGLVGGTRIYGGGGIGPYFGEVTRFGGKVFIGADLVSRIGVEVGVHFPGFGDPLITAQARLGL